MRRFGVCARLLQDSTCVCRSANTSVHAQCVKGCVVLPITCNIVWFAGSGPVFIHHVVVALMLRAHTVFAVANQTGPALHLAMMLTGPVLIWSFNVCVCVCDFISGSIHVSL